MAGIAGDELTPAIVRGAAAAFGSYLRRDRLTDTATSVVLAGDERPLSAELIAAAADGLRYSGCGVIDLGGATSAGLTSNLARLKADGGLLVGNPLSQARTTGLKFWHDAGRPLSAGRAVAGSSLDDVRRHFEQPNSRPTRRYGPWQRSAVEPSYLDGLRHYFHALRPLQLVIETGSQPFKRYTEKLLVNVGCQAIFTNSPRQIERDAHFALWVDGDGECCRLTDEQGRPVAWDRLLALLAEHLLTERPGAYVLAGAEVSPEIARRIASAGGRLLTTGSTRAEMDDAMRQSPAILGGEPGGRFWFARADGPSADALEALAVLLTVLSRSDRPLSEVVHT